MIEKRNYQLGYSLLHPEVTDSDSRKRKAETATLVLEYYLGRPLSGLRILDVGGSSGIMAEFMALRGNTVTVIDMDEHAIELAHARATSCSVSYHVADAMSIPFADGCFDAVLCCHVYEHVPDPRRMMAEMHRILRPGGVCYFTAGNRMAWREPHYGLPLLSVLPRALAHHYLRLSRRGTHYHEKHLGLPGLRKLVREFSLNDMTALMLSDPARFRIDYMVKPTGAVRWVAHFIAHYLPVVCPGFIWVLEKSSTQAPRRG
jgi:2-polyprenyl-3-methyl-5-hydroxy-6-metoxy-1,4-benzoquinol methylase